MQDRNKIDSIWMYERLRPFVRADAQTNITTTNCCNYYKQLEESYPQDSIQQLERKYRAFLVFKQKMEETMRMLENRLGADKEISLIRNRIEKRQNQLENKLKGLRKHTSQLSQEPIESVKLLANESKRSDQSGLHEEIEEELLGLTNYLKIYAQNIQTNLKTDEKILNNIEKGQEVSESALKRSTNRMKEMMKNPQLGFFQLLFMAGVSIAAFLVTCMFIIIV